MSTTLRIERLAPGGAGVARHEGRAVFVAGAAPGELLDVDIDARSKPPRATILRVVEPSADRVAPPCRFVAACGGCDWMHLTADAAEREHAAIVASAIEHATRAAPPAIVRHRVAPELGYRTRARLHIEAKRGKAKVGYRAAHSHALAAVDACVVLHPSIAHAIAELSDVLGGARGEGEANVARGLAGKLVVDLAWEGELAGPVWSAIDQRVAIGAWAGARVTLSRAVTPATFGDPRPRIEGPDGAPLVIAAGGFAQPSDGGAAILARRAAELATSGAKSSPRIVELFAGSGTLSVLLARATESFTSVEISPAAVACARENFEARGVANGKLVTADAEAFAIPKDAGIVVLDPPRSGAPRAAKSIAASKAKTVVYVSCDAQTLARDLAALTSGPFELTHLETVELFPQTSHVEVIARLARRAT